ncbi:MAG: hypothetical protein M3P50_03080 [Actinomycetota bacterium]|nr:hypothetical protein [Actinomycetota bacterium]
MAMMTKMLVRLSKDPIWKTDPFKKRSDPTACYWMDHPDVLGDLPFAQGYYMEPDWLAERRFIRRGRLPRRRLRTQLDWGAWLVEVTLEELHRLLGRWPEYADIRADWDEPFRKGRSEEADMLASLDPRERYAVVWVELH